MTGSQCPPEKTRTLSLIVRRHCTMKKTGTQKHRAVALRAADSAESVLAYFEERHPQDTRPRRAIEAARAWACGDLAMTDARVAAFAAHAAAREASHPSACFAARAAGHAAATAHVATHAPHAVAYATKAWAAASDDKRRTPNHRIGCAAGCAGRLNCI